MSQLRALLGLGALLSMLPSAELRAVTVRAHIEMAVADHGQTSAGNSDVVVWLTSRAGSVDASKATVIPGHFRMEQKGKNFHPHLLVIPLGSSVEFPNLDPFFHNVFSQFNGKRFDLGLYEAGSTRTVHFDHEGVSYLFCNIHSNMAAVVVTLATPYFAVARGTGSVELHDVPPGDYELHVWAEGEAPADLAHAARPVHVGTTDIDLGVLRTLIPHAHSEHKNKYGEDYAPDHIAPYP